MDKYCLVIEIETKTEFIAKSILKTIEKELNKTYRDIDLKSNVIKNIDTSKWLKFIQEVNKEFEFNL